MGTNAAQPFRHTDKKRAACQEVAQVRAVQPPVLRPCPASGWWPPCGVGGTRGDHRSAQAKVCPCPTHTQKEDSVFPAHRAVSHSHALPSPICDPPGRSQCPGHILESSFRDDDTGQESPPSKALASGQWASQHWQVLCSRQAGLPKTPINQGIKTSFTPEPAAQQPGFSPTSGQHQVSTKKVPLNTVGRKTPAQLLSRATAGGRLLPLNTGTHT